MEYYSAIKRNAFESVLMRMNLDPVIQSEVRKKKRNTIYLFSYCIFVICYSAYIYMESRKMVLMNLYSGQE